VRAETTHDDVEPVRVERASNARDPFVIARHAGLGHGACS
jgi:hypothetical protein